MNKRAARIISKCICYISKEKSESKYLKDKIYHKLRDHCHYTGEYSGAAHSICNLQCT